MARSAACTANLGWCPCTALRIDKHACAFAVARQPHNSLKHCPADASPIWFCLCYLSVVVARGSSPAWQEACSVLHSQRIAVPAGSPVLVDAPHFAHTMIRWSECWLLPHLRRKNGFVASRLCTPAYLSCLGGDRHTDCVCLQVYMGRRQVSAVCMC